MIQQVRLLIAGFVILIFGADILAPNSYLINRLKISELAIALTVVAFGTSIAQGLSKHRFKLLVM